VIAEWQHSDEQGTDTQFDQDRSAGFPVQKQTDHEIDTVPNTGNPHAGKDPPRQAFAESFPLGLAANEVIARHFISFSAAQRPASPFANPHPRG
jgi:hypothetical protein